MKQVIFLVTIVFTLLASGCKTKPNAHKPSPSGGAGVMIIVMNDNVKKTEAGKKLWDMMVQPMLGLPQDEPMFDVSVIPHSAVSDFMKTYRNLIMVKMGDGVEKEGIFFYKDTWAQTQALVRINAKTPESFLNLVEKNELKLVGFFTKAERNRLTSYYKTTFNKELQDKVKTKWNYNLTIPRDFSLRKESNNFLWMSQETSLTSLGLLMYEVDYVGEGSFSKEYLLNERNRILQEQVPGPTKGSYMTTELNFPVLYQVVKIPGDTASVVLRGLWKVQGDMMGGPFISMAHLDKKNKKIIVTEGYCFNPQKPKKRNMIRQLEAILYSYNPLKEKKDKKQK